jgi:hypothetical protein
MAGEPQANQPPRSDLPAPYQNPWTALGDALWAVRADLGLRIRELWRRNSEGSLQRPRWWPRDLAPLFWPLLLAALLALVIAAGLGVQRWQESRGASPSPMAAAGPAPELERDPTGAPDVEPAPQQERQPGPEPAQDPVPVPDAEPEADGPVNDGGPVEAEPTPAPDPLAFLLRRPEANGLLLSASGEPASSTLTLQVRSTFLGLSVAEQQRRADQWQQWAQELGYEHVLLRDSGSGLLARDALVGSGMIVLTSPR